MLHLLSVKRPNILALDLNSDFDLWSMKDCYRL